MVTDRRPRRSAVGHGQPVVERSGDGAEYFGTILYQEGTTTHATTIVRIDN
jgi:hypothetical protein